MESKRNQQQHDDRPFGGSSPDPKHDPRMRQCATHGARLYPGELCAQCLSQVEG